MACPGAECPFHYSVHEGKLDGRNIFWISTFSFCKMPLQLSCNCPQYLNTHSFQIHTTVMCTAAMFMAAALTCGVWHSIAQQSLASQFEERLHTIVGSVVLVLFVIQLFLGYLRPKAAPVRTVVNIVHFFVGTITYFASSE